MKKIEAIIRKTKFQEVKDTLHDSGIDFFSFFPVTGVGKATQSRVYRGIAYDTSSIGRLLITIVVRDINLDKTVNAINRVTSKRTNRENLSLFIILSQNQGKNQSKIS